MRISVKHQDGPTYPNIYVKKENNRFWQIRRRNRFNYTLAKDDRAEANPTANNDEKEG